MSRSHIRTWLSLDEFGQIIGLSPFGLNQLHHNRLQPNTVCGEVFFQQSWQHSDRVGRDDIAQAIQEAEQEIALEAGFNLMPDWVLDERQPYPAPAVPGAFGNGLNVRAMSKSLEVAKGYVISGGFRRKVLVEAGATITLSDVDADGYQETCQVIVPVSITNTSEIRLFYPAHDGEDAWEIRPIKVSISGGQATITFKRWQVAAANQMDSMEAKVLDATLNTSYESTVDVYYVYNDHSTQAAFLWENGDGCTDCCGSCAACQFGSQSACFHTRDPRLGFVVPTPATWDADTEEFVSTAYAACREPDQIRLWYYSGYVDNHLARPYAELSPYWKSTIAYYAASKFDRPVCGCSNVEQFIEKWREDLARSDKQRSYTLTPDLLGNKFGTTAGAIYAWKQVHKTGVRVGK